MDSASPITTNAYAGLASPTKSVVDLSWMLNFARRNMAPAAGINDINASVSLIPDILLKYE